MSADHARRVLRRLLKTMQVAHEREQAPSIFEIKYLISFVLRIFIYLFWRGPQGSNPLCCATPPKRALADSTPIMCMVELPDGDVKAFAVESHTTLQEVQLAPQLPATTWLPREPCVKLHAMFRQASKDFATKLGLPAKFTEGWGLWQSGLDGTLICRHRTAHRLLLMTLHKISYFPRLLPAQADAVGLRRLGAVGKGHLRFHRRII